MGIPGIIGIPPYIPGIPYTPGIPIIPCIPGIPANIPNGEGPKTTIIGYWPIIGGIMFLFLGS